MMDSSTGAPMAAPMASPLPFEKPKSIGCCPAVAVPFLKSSFKFWLKASTLNFIVTRYTALAPELGFWSSSLVYLPVFAFVRVSVVSAEFAVREWIYYRMLEHDVLIQFEPRDDISSLMSSEGALYVMGSAVFVLGLMLYVSISGLHISAQLDDYEDQMPWSAMFNVLTQAVLMVIELHSIRKINVRCSSITFDHLRSRLRSPSLPITRLRRYGSSRSTRCSPPPTTRRGPSNG